MKHKFIIFCTLLTMLSCAKDDSTNPTCVPQTRNPSDECVSVEDITSTITDFTMLNKGLQEEGIASGIKINEEWEASTFLYHYDSSFSILAITYWVWGTPTQSSYVTGEVLSLAYIPINNSIGCYNLTSEISPSDSVYCGYRVDEYDINLLRYTLDESKENKLEILEYDQASGILKAKLKASFITEEASEPDFPEKVRFFNVDIETY
jgi:hypothetical protein